MWSNIQDINPREFRGRRLSEEKILELFNLCDAVWLHDGDPRRPHAELTSGKCSNGFFDCMRVLKHPNLCEILARQLAKRIREEGVGSRIDWVIGSPYAGITFSYEVARVFQAIHGFPEKDPSDPKGKRFVWQRLTIPAGANVLQVEELITTARTLQEVRRAITEGNPEPVNWIPIVGTLVHRPPKLPVEYNNIKVVALVEREIWAVEPDECPLCKKGSPRLRPKTHWEQLTGKR